jgi:hypothetical protein
VSVLFARVRVQDDGRVLFGDVKVRFRVSRFSSGILISLSYPLSHDLMSARSFSVFVACHKLSLYSAAYGTPLLGIDPPIPPPPHPSPPPALSQTHTHTLHNAPGFDAEGSTLGGEAGADIRSPREPRVAPPAWACALRSQCILLKKSFYLGPVLLP